jgi:hypothetical protein
MAGSRACNRVFVVAIGEPDAFVLEELEPGRQTFVKPVEVVATKLIDCNNYHKP